MFETICQTIPADPHLAPRARRLEIYRRVLEGTIYDALPYAFQEERNGAGEYVPLRARRPSVRYGLCRIVVEDSVSLLFSAGISLRSSARTRRPRRCWPTFWVNAGSMR
ncbi:unnamed protein product [Acidocella sp. C78]|uniref:hypothetical protein n=1 Tax=Acidocella sp. C78 TaxID=1671486 RepID=UPI001BC39A28|nr:hypothetical protein [Acidocella sp. C78]CAG4921515.1 unnamed protein product [Acidocella sp. C78]